MNISREGGTFMTGKLDSSEDWMNKTDGLIRENK